MNNWKKGLYVLMAFLFLNACKGGGKDPQSTTPLVVATTSWTAAYAVAAGAQHPVVLAPFEMAHPSEYELRPGDIPKLMKAEVIVYAGYEVMTERLRKGLDLPEEKLLLIDTDYHKETIEQSVMQIAARLGTEVIAREKLLEIRRVLDEGRAVIEKNHLQGQPVIVHRFQASIARELGLEPVMLFGPAAPEASEISTAAKIKTALIIDNLHNPVGQPFHEVLPHARYVRLLNFPGLHHTQTLTDVIRYNIAQLSAVTPSHEWLPGSE